METWYLAPMLNDLRMSFSLCFKDNVFVFDKKGENLNAQPSTLETVMVFLTEIRKKIKVCYLAIRLLNKKMPTKFKSSNIGCSKFLQKDGY